MLQRVQYSLVSFIFSNFEVLIPAEWQFKFHLGNTISHQQTTNYTAWYDHSTILQMHYFQNPRTIWKLALRSLYPTFCFRVYNKSTFHTTSVALSRTRKLGSFHLKITRFLVRMRSYWSSWVTFTQILQQAEVFQDLQVTTAIIEWKIVAWRWDGEHTILLNSKLFGESDFPQKDTSAAVVKVYMEVTHTHFTIKLFNYSLILWNPPEDLKFGPN